MKQNKLSIFNSKWIKGIACISLLCGLTAGFQSCSYEKEIIASAKQNLDHHDYRKAMDEILTLSDSHILKSDSLVMLLSAAYYGVEHERQTPRYMGLNIYDFDILKNRKLAIVTDFSDNKLNVYSYPDLILKNTIPLPDRAFSVDVSPDESKIAVALENGNVMIYNLDTNQEEMLAGAHSSRVRGVAFKGNDVLFSCGNDQTVVAWDLDNKDVFWRAHLHSRNIKSMHVSNDDFKLITASNDGSSCILNADTEFDKSSLQSLAHGIQYVNDAALSPNNNYAVTVSGDGTISKWDAKNGFKYETTDLGQSLCSVAFTKDGKKVIAGGSKDVFILDSESMLPEYIFSGNNRPFWSVQVDGDGNIIAVDTREVYSFPIMTKEKLIEAARALK